MFERFTDRARRVVVLSQDEATRLKHNYIGTEHIVLGLLAEPGGVASRALAGLGMTLEGARREVGELVPPGTADPPGRIPFTPRAKKTLELALREALALNHSYIGTEHLLLGVLKEGETSGYEGIGIMVLRRHAEPAAIREAVLSLLPPPDPETAHARRWRRARSAGLADLPRAAIEALSRATTEQPALNATPAADATLNEAAKLAGTQPVGSHHLLLAALADPDTAAARVLTVLGVNLDHARAALREVDVTGTSDELPEEAGRRRMIIQVTADRLTLEATDPALIRAGHEALAALGEEARASGIIRGDQPVSASLGRAWQALFDSLTDIGRRAATARPAAEPAEPG